MLPQKDLGAEGRQRPGNRFMVSAALRWATLLDYLQLGMTDAPTAGRARGRCARRAAGGAHAVCHASRSSAGFMARCGCSCGQAFAGSVAFADRCAYGGPSVSHSGGPLPCVFKTFLA